MDTNQRPLAGVTVVALNSNQTCLSDTSGHFVLPLGPLAGNANIVIMGQVAGYGRVIRAFSLPAGNVALFFTPAITGSIDLDIAANANTVVDDPNTGGDPNASDDPNASAGPADGNLTVPGAARLAGRHLAGGCPPGAGPGPYGRTQQQVPCVCGDGGLPDPTYGCVCPSPRVHLLQSGSCVCVNPPCPDQAVITATQSGLTANIGLASGALVDAAGNRVNGTVDYAITLWGPNAAVNGSPVPLVAGSGTTMTGLQSFGMADMQFFKNNQPLNLLDRSSVQLTIVATPQQQSLLAAGYPQPSLWTVDAGSGTWTHSNAAGTVMVYDGSKFVADVMDVSQPWNVDGDIQASNGGCVTGRVRNACNPSQVLSNSKVTVWFMGTEQVRDFSGQTSGNGSYCIATPLANFWPGLNASVQTVNYFVSAQGKPATTSQCNPAPPACTQCNPDYEAWPENSRFCTNCTLQTGTSHNPGDPAAYADSCQGGMLAAALTPCTFCPGDPSTPQQCLAGSSQTQASTACTQLADLIVPGPGCTCKMSGSACVPGDTCCASGSGAVEACGPGNTCQVCTVRGLGSPCDSKDVCCGNAGDPPLVCADNVCVPYQDPIFTE